jgi:hypothetical protein
LKPPIRQWLIVVTIVIFIVVTIVNWVTIINQH